MTMTNFTKRLQYRVSFSIIQPARVRLINIDLARAKLVVEQRRDDVRSLLSIIHVWMIRLVLRHRCMRLLDRALMSPSPYCMPLLFNLSFVDVQTFCPSSVLTR